MAKAPGPGSLETLGLIASARGDLRAVFTELARRYGDTVRARVGPSSFYLVSHPDQIEDILETNGHRFERVDGERRVSGRLVDDGLFTSEGELHLQRREILEAVMYPHAAAALAGEVLEVAAAWRDRLQDGATIDLFAWVEDFTTAIMIRLLFGRGPSDAAGDRLARAMTETIAAMDALPMPFARLPERLPATKRRYERARAGLDALIYDVIAERRAAAANDVVSMLIRAGEERGGGLTDAQLRNELVTLFRGHQAVSTALTWTFHQLAPLPEVEATLHEEIDSALGERLPTYEDLPRLEYTKMVFSESLRLLPPAWVLARKAVAGHEVGGFEIPAGSRVLLSEWVTHRDPRFWPDPERFHPLRFAPEAQILRPEYAYFPQGGGSKMCMGRHFVRPMEGPLLLATIAQRWRMRPAPGSAVRMAARATLKPKRGVWMVVERRG